MAINIKVPEPAHVTLSITLQSAPTMQTQLRFSHKIVMAACLVVMSVFLAFAVYNDYIQRKALQDNLRTYLADAGSLTAENISLNS